MKRAWILMLMLGLAAMPLLAQTTGTIEGTVTDEHGAALPGVTVEATSPNLQGTKIAITDPGGKLHFVFMPPGIYKVRFTLPGFATLEQSDINVTLGHSVTLNVQMHGAFKEEVVVSGAALTIDVKSVEAGATLNSAMYSRLPVGRTYLAVAQMTPGVNQDFNGNITVYGSGGAENSYYIDGIDTTEVQYGRAGKQLNQEFIEETQVKTGGFQAEYGRTTGGVVNVITKSGGNEFHVDVFGYYDPDKWQGSIASDVLNYNENQSGSNYQSGYNRQDYGVDLGGFVVKDKLWFFVAYDRVNYDNYYTVAKDFTLYGGPPMGKVYDRTDTRDLWAGKLTWRIGGNQSIIAALNGDPRTQSGANPVRGLAGPETSFVEDIKRGGTDWALKYEGVLGTNWVVNAAATQHKEQFVESGAGTEAPLMLDYSSALYDQTGTILQTGGYGYYNANKQERDDYRGDVSYFLNDFGGDHEFKIGGEWEHVPIATNTYHSGGQLIYQRCLPGNLTSDGCPAADIYYYHEVFLNAWPAGGVGDPNFASYIINPQSVTSKTDSYATYFQDTWHLGKNFTIDLGIRYEEQKLYNMYQTVSAHLKDEWAPRVGFAWDWKGDGTTKLFGSFGRYYETIPTDIVTRSFGGEISTLMANTSLTDVACDIPFATQYHRTCRIVGPQSVADLELVDPNLKGQYVDHMQLGVELQVAKDLIVGASYIYRTLGRVIEDSLATTGDYYIGNPGTGLLTQNVEEDYTHFLPAVKPTRKFTGFELTARKRFSDNWQLMASYLYSKLEGTYDGTFQYSTGQLDPNINSAYDYAEFQVHDKGRLYNDRPHQFKVYAAYTAPFGLTIGADAYWQSGIPITARGWDDSYRNYEYYLSDRGAWGRTPSEYEADLHLGYPIKLGGDLSLNIMVDVFNLLNRQGVTGVDEGYTRESQAINVVNYDTGQPLPAIKPGTPCSSVTDESNCNPNFGKANLWQAARSIRLGVRLSF